MNHFLIRALLAISLGGCAATSDLPHAYTLDAEHGEGLAIVSLTMSGKVLDTVSSFEYQIREVSPRDEEAVMAKPYFNSARQHARWVQQGGERRQAVWNVVVKGPNFSGALDIVDAGKATGRLVSLRLPAGEYEFYAWKVRETNRYGGMEYGPRQAFSYRFGVKPGEGTYLGRLNLHLSERDTHRITVADQRSGDIAILREKHPSIGIDRIVLGVGEIQP